MIKPIYKNIIQTNEEINDLEIKLDKLKEETGVKELEDKLEEKTKLFNSHKDYLKDQFVKNKKNFQEIIDPKSNQVFHFRLKSRNSYGVDMEKLQQEKPDLIKEYTTFDIAEFKKTKYYKDYKTITKISHSGIDVNALPMKKEK